MEIPRLFEEPKNGGPATRINERMVFSLNLVVVIVVLTIWISKLESKAEEAALIAKKLNPIVDSLRDRVYTLEERCHIRHQTKGEE